MRAYAALLSVALGALAAVGVSTAARAEPTSGATQVLDRTYACAVFFRGGTYLLDVHAHAGTRRGAAWARLPYAGVRSGVFSGGPGNLVAWITSGKPVASTMIDQDYDAFDVKTYGTVGIRRDGCRSSSARIPLTSAGLRGTAAPPLGSKSECFGPKRVLVRVRAVLATAGSLRSGPDFQATRTPVRQAKLAVRTTSGKPLVYADVSESGRARLFTASGCVSQ